MADIERRPAPTPPLSNGRRLLNILGGSAGNFVEWFDWFAYVSFAIYFSRAVFPADDETTQLLLAYLPFALGFIARPVGAYVMGVYADRAGRKTALAVSVSIMCVGSLVIAFIPTHSQAGALSAVLLTLARIAQGWSVGGEYGASSTYVAEMAEEGRRGFWSGFLYLTIIAGQLAAMLLLVLLQAILTEEQMYSWGWRVPFVIGALMGVITFWMRARMHETPQFHAASRRADKGRAVDLIGEHRRASIAIVILTAGGGAAFYFYTGYLKDFLVNSAAGPSGAGFDKTTAAIIASVLLVFFMVLQPVMGALSDLVGRKRVLVGSFAIGGLIAYPAMSAVQRATEATDVIAALVLPLVALAGYTSISAIFKAEMFPAHIRASGVAVPHAVAQALFGGNVATVALSLKRAGSEELMYWIIAALLAAGFVVAAVLPDSRKASLITGD